MIRIDVSADVRRAVNRLDAVARSQVPFATAKTLTLAAKAGQAALKQEMQSVFDRPTRYTLNAVRIKPATKRSLTAEIALKSQARSSSAKPHYLQAQIEGGNRAHKLFEDWMRHHGMLGADEVLVPSRSAAKNTYGNLPLATYKRIMAQLSDPLATGGLYLWSPGVHSRVAKRRGIWRRVGTRIQPVLLAVSATNYRPRFRFYDVGRRELMRAFRERFHAELQHAIATAK